MNKIENRIKELIKIINEASEHYYNSASPIISDKEWDSYYDELKKLENETGIIYEDSPTKKVGANIVKAFTPHTHIARLYSMDKVQSIDELELWYNKTQKTYENYCKENNIKFNKLDFTLEYKLDGLTLNLTYNDGKLTQASTRGNGYVGESVYNQALSISSIPSNIDYKGQIEIQGECIMRLSVLNEYNAKNNDTLKNARNAAAGAIRNIDPKITKERNLDAYFYSIGFDSNNEKPYLTQEELIIFLKNMNLDVSPFIKKCASFKEISDTIDEIAKNRDSLDFLIDGVVLKINDINKRSIFGYTEKFPKWAVAYKFDAEEATTILKNVTWEVGRTGKITPLAHVEKVEICGATISKATLNNYNDILRKKLKLGSRVWIRRSNDVIPEILGIVEDNNNNNLHEINPPTKCPSCGSQLYEDGANVFCPSTKTCKAQIIAKLCHFCSKECMDISGLSSKTINLLFENKIINSIVDIYDINYNKLSKLDNFKDKKISNLIQSIEESKNIDFENFINALGINNVGKKMSKDLASKFNTLEDLAKATTDELVEIEDIGNIVAQSIRNFFDDEENKNTISSLLKKGLNIKYRDKSNNKLNGLTFVVTGSFENLTRNQIEKLINDNGGKVSSSVSKKTNYLVKGENPGIKYDKALSLNIKIIDDNILNELIK